MARATVRVVVVRVVVVAGFVAAVGVVRFTVLVVVFATGADWVVAGSVVVVVVVSVVVGVAPVVGAGSVVVEVDGGGAEVAG